MKWKYSIQKPRLQYILDHLLLKKIQHLAIYITETSMNYNHHDNDLKIPILAVSNKLKLVINW